MIRYEFRKPEGKTAQVLMELSRLWIQEDCCCINLATSTKNYKGILKLYIEELGMCFSSAFLFKRTQEEIQ